MDEVLPARVLPAGVVPADWGRPDRRWNDRVLVLCGLLWAWDDGGTSADRFAARRCVAEMFPGRRRPGGTYTGFMATLREYTASWLPAPQGCLRRWMAERPGGPGRDRPHWRYGGRLVRIAADGSPARALRVVRTAIDRPRDKSPNGGVAARLRRAVNDDYVRTGRQAGPHPPGQGGQAPRQAKRA